MQSRASLCTIPARTLYCGTRTVGPTNPPRLQLQTAQLRDPFKTQEPAPPANRSYSPFSTSSADVRSRAARRIFSDIKKTAPTCQTIKQACDATRNPPTCQPCARPGLTAPCHGRGRVLVATKRVADRAETLRSVTIVEQAEAPASQSVACKTGFQRTKLLLCLVVRTVGVYTVGSGSGRNGRMFTRQSDRGERATATRWWSEHATV